MKIGLFGGTFDPIHIGHLIIAQFSLEKVGLDKVVFVPANVSPFKEGHETLFQSVHRLEMVKLAIEGNPNFEVSDFEINLNQVSYSYITVDHFSRIYSGDEIFLIIGADNFVDFCKWKNYQNIIDKAKLVVYPRLGVDFLVPDCLRKYIDKIVLLDVPIFDISSTMIRNRIREKMSVRYFLPHKVYEYIDCILRKV